MTNPDKTFWRHMHQKTPYEFNTGNGQLFPFSFVSVIFYKEGDGFIIHADNAVIADGNPMGILSKVINHRLRTVKSFLILIQKSRCRADNRCPFLQSVFHGCPAQ